MGEYRTAVMKLKEMSSLKNLYILGIVIIHFDYQG
jgi:hypothetical protein